MSIKHDSSQFSVSSAVFNLLDPIPFGFFVGALIFDVLYANIAAVLYAKGASWLITLGLLFAIVPQIINLVIVWFSKRRVRSRGQVINFWLNVVGIVAALLNAFVHTRDGYSVIPDAIWLSILTVLAMGIGRIVLAGEKVTYGETIHGRA